jgi:hypothetical protein
MTKQESAAKIFEAITTIMDIWFEAQMEEIYTEDTYDDDDGDLPF